MAQQAHESFGIDIHNWRKTYLNKEEPILLEEDLPSKDPFRIFDVWFKNIACRTDISVTEVNAVVFTTACDNRPTSRMVLMKEYDMEGFSFYTNYNSRKGTELSKNPFACMLFFWPSVHRQIRIEGKVERLPVEKADAYWKTRPIKSRIGSKLSEQSSVIPSRKFLTDKRTELEKLVAEKGETAIAKPNSW